jgi:hypothetical protein
MGHESLFAAHDLAVLYDWLQETGELYLDLDRPHSGGSNSSAHFVHSLAELRAIVSRETWPEVVISIFRAKQYPIRGIADDRLLTAALEQIGDGQWFSILSLGDAPLDPCRDLGRGDGHEKLREEFARLAGRQILVGQDPYDYGSSETFFNTPEEVFVVRFYQRPAPSVSKNRASYAPFDAAPDRYRPHVDFW